jgi:hypothetical protein
VVVMSAKHHLPDVDLLHAHLMVIAMPIKFCEEIGAAEFVQELVDDREEEHVMHSFGVQGLIITHNFHDPSCVLTSRTVNEKAEGMGQMMPYCSMSLHWCLSSPLSSCG